MHALLCMDDTTPKLYSVERGISRVYQGLKFICVEVDLHNNVVITFYTEILGFFVLILSTCCRGDSLNQLQVSIFDSMYGILVNHNIA